MLFYFFQLSPHSFDIYCFAFVKDFSFQFNPPMLVFFVPSNLFFILIFTLILLSAVFCAIMFFSVSSFGGWFV
jgi:hypothetical protein